VKSLKASPEISLFLRGEIEIKKPPFTDGFFWLICTKYKLILSKTTYLGPISCYSAEISTSVGLISEGSSFVKNPKELSTSRACISEAKRF
jgi:hypothetical protein